MSSNCSSDSSKKSYNNLDLLCYADQKAIFSAKGFDAIIYLIATYWIYNIHFPKDAQQQFAFLAIAVLRQEGKKSIKQDILNKISLSSALKAASLKID